VTSYGMQIIAKDIKERLLCSEIYFASLEIKVPSLL
jgi:hypothetical protein